MTRKRAITKKNVHLDRNKANYYPIAGANSPRRKRRHTPRNSPRGNRTAPRTRTNKPGPRRRRFSEALTKLPSPACGRGLGERLTEDQQKGATPFTPRCTQDAIEEALFDRRRDLFSHLDLVFFDTTSIYFEGEGGVELGQYGHNKDHRPGLQADGRRRDPRRRRATAMLRVVAWQCDRHEDADSGGGPAATTFSHPLNLHRGRPRHDLEALQYTEVENQEKRFLLRSDLATTTAAVFRAVGVAIPVSIQKIEE